MTDRSVHEELRDQALRDILDLEDQVSRGELPPSVAAGLRQRYEVTASRALNALATTQEREQPTEPRSSRPRSTAVRLAYGVGVAGALVALLVLLPSSVGPRPVGGFVTGNEVLQDPSDAGPEAIVDPEAGATPRDISTVSNADMEVVVAANPTVIDMRLALANRYADGGDYAAAVRHYSVALEQQPDNVEALAHYGWALLQLGDVSGAAGSVRRALAEDPQHQEALWFQANIELYGLADPAAALVVLEQLQAIDDLEPVVRTQVEDLMSTARQEQEAGG